jgi:hypothetical protein
MCISITDMKTTLAQLERKRTQLLHKIEKLSPWIQGSLVSTSRFCGKPNCACHHGGPKHPVLFITSSENGKTISLYVPRQLERQVLTWSANYKKLKEVLRELSEIQRQVIRLREPAP